MKWFVVVEAVVAALRASSGLTAALGTGTRIVRAGANREKVVPSIEWFRVTNPLEENTERVHIQFDIWTNSTKKAAQIETHMRAALLGHGAHAVGGLLMLTPEEEVDSRDLPDPEPELVHNVLDIVFVAARPTLVG